MTKHRKEAREWERANPEYTAFRKQRSRARVRGIEWCLTFEEWRAWWGDDIVLRGRSAGSLVMCRIGDVGPYALGNIYKDTLSGNTAFMQRRLASAA